MSIDKQYEYVTECENNILFVDIYYSDKILQIHETEPIKRNIINNWENIKYKPIRIIYFNYDSHNTNINELVKINMRKYGINNVRGGDYTNLELSQKQIDKLNFELLGYDYCINCRKCHRDSEDCLGKNIDTSTFLQDCNDYNTILVKINYITNIYDKTCLLKNQLNEIMYIRSLPGNINKDKFNTIYKKYIMNNNDPDNMTELKDYSIKKNELESILFDKKLELINIYKVHKSEYYLKDILTELYKRKFIHMEKFI